MLESLGLGDVPLPVLAVMVVLAIAILATVWGMRPGKDGKTAYKMDNSQLAYLAELQAARDRGEIEFEEYEERVNELYGR